MDLRVVREYRRLRAKSWAAGDALRSARIKIAFDDLESQGLVELRIESDPEPYDMSYVDTWADRTERQREHEKRKLAELIARWGVYGLVGCYRLSKDHEWEHVDSCWGFIGNDLSDNGYDVDIMSNTIAKLREAQEDAAAQAAHDALVSRMSAYVPESAPADGW